MPVYRVIRKPFYTVAGPVAVGDVIDLPEQVGSPHRNLELVEAPPAEAPAETPVTALLDRLGGEIVSLLTQDYETVEQVQAAGDTELLAVQGIGPATLAKIRKAIE